MTSPFQANLMPVSAYGGSLKNLKDLKVSHALRHILQHVTKPARDWYKSNNPTFRIRTFSASSGRPVANKRIRCFSAPGITQQESQFPHLLVGMVASWPSHKSTSHPTTYVSPHTLRGLYSNMKHSLLHREVDDRDEICLGFFSN